MRADSISVDLMTTGVRHVAEQLVERGLREAFGVAGSGVSLQLITALEDLGATYYPVANESTAALIAGGVFAGAGRLAAAISIKGPGFANMLPGIVCNHLENRASITLSEAYGNDVPKFRRHKRIDQIAAGGQFFKSWATLDRVSDSLPRLLNHALEEIPGPVHLELCNAPGPAISGQLDPGTVERPMPGGVAGVLRRSRRPVVIAGSLARRRPWGQLLSSLRCPIFTTASAKGIVDERTPFSAGVYTGDGRTLAFESSILPLADCIIGLGLRNIEVVNPRSFGDRGVLLDEVTGYSEGFDGVAVCDSAAPEFVFDALRDVHWGEDAIEKAREQLCDRVAQQEWSPAICMNSLNGLSADHALVADTGNFCTVAEQCWMAGPDRPFVGSGNARYMGVGLPTGIGVALAQRSRPVIIVAGDGGIRPYFPELVLALEESLPVCMVLVSDGVFSSVVGAAPESARRSRALSIASPSWWRGAEGIGLDACRVESRTQFEEALSAWSRTRPLFIEAVFDPSEYAVIPNLLRA
jgi:thiamine pyrophosphate-dependent acetolactate synthase large subunit-like protein